MIDIQTLLGAVSRKYAHKIPFLVKLNHNELLTYPAMHDQTLFTSVQKAFDLGAVAVGATVYYASQESRRQIMEVSEAFARAHELGMVTFLWAYLRNADFKKDDTDYHTASDLTGQANHLAATIEADVVKQKQAATNGGFTAIELGKTHPKVYSELTSDHPIDPPPRVDGLCNCQRLRARAISTKILPADARFGSFPEKCLRALFEECRHRCDPVFRTSRMARVLEAQSAMRSTDLASGWTTLAAPKAESPRRSRTTDPRRAMRS